MNFENRLSKLEAKAPAEDDWKVFRVIGETQEECQAGIDRRVRRGRLIVSWAGSLSHPACGPMVRSIPSRPKRNRQRIASHARRLRR
jgi:hypothetical protein